MEDRQARSVEPDAEEPTPRTDRDFTAHNDVAPPASDEYAAVPAQPEARWTGAPGPGSIIQGNIEIVASDPTRSLFDRESTGRPGRPWAEIVELMRMRRQLRREQRQRRRG
jgi:hypothetical protein